jgi:ABC-type multidrug transport system permease subunit
LGYRVDATSIQARVALMFFVAAFFVFMSVAVLPFIIEERAVFVREKRNGAYTVPPYVVAALIALLPSTFSIAITTTIIIVFMAHLQGFGYYLLCLWFSLIFAECFVLFVGAISPHYIIGIAAAAGFFGLCMVVEGFFIVFNTIGWYIRWMGYVTPHRYSFRAFMRNEFNSLVDTSGNVTVPVGQDILNFYQFNDAYVQSIGGDLGIMLLFAASYVFLFWLVLEFYW